MKKYTYEAAKRQWEKPTEPQYVFSAAASVTVCAENETEAIELADKALTEQYFGSGVILQDLRMVSCTDLPVDWNYGYGDDRGSGSPADRLALIRDNTLL